MTTAIAANSQTEEKWFAIVQFEDGFTDQVILHLKPTGNSETLMIDFPLKNLESFGITNQIMAFR